MVRKITGNTPTRPTEGASGVKSSQEIQSKKIDGVEKVGGVQSKTSVGGTRKATRPMTAEERAHLMNLIDEEAARLFADGALTGEQREVVTQSVKMTIDASIVENSDESKKKN